MVSKSSGEYILDSEPIFEFNVLHKDNQTIIKIF